MSVLPKTVTEMTLKEAKSIIGSLGNADKMPCKTYGLPACEAKWVPLYCKMLGFALPLNYGCSTGQKLAKNPDSPCHICYADERGNYSYDSCKHGQVKRLVGVFHPHWKYAMARMISHYTNPSEPYFRWLDSGDVLNRKMLMDIIWIAHVLPHITFWLPTQEIKMVRDITSNHFLDFEIPENLTIRISSPVKNKHKVNLKGLPKSVCSSSVSSNGKYTCPSDQYENTCGPCRDCWDISVKHKIYKEH